MKQILILMSIIFLCACEKCDCGETSNNQSTTPKDVYYIRYSCRTGGMAHSTVTMTYTDTNGQSTKLTGKLTVGLSQTIGPVAYGFKAKVSSDVKNAKIECCKNNGPFMTKAEGNGGCSYTIDF